MAIRGPQGRAVPDVLRADRPKMTVRVRTMDQARHYWQSMGQPVKGKFLAAVRKSSRYTSAGPG